MDEPMRLRTPDEQAAVEDFYESCDTHNKLYHPDKGCLQCDEGWDDLHDMMFDAKGG